MTIWTKQGNIAIPEGCTLVDYVEKHTRDERERARVPLHRLLP